MTPRDLLLIVDEHNERDQKHTEELITQAYFTAKFMRSRRMPSLKRVLEDAKPKKPMQPQSPEQMLAFAMQFQSKLERSDR